MGISELTSPGLGQENIIRKSAITVEVYRKEEEKWLCSPLRSAGDVDKTHISTPPTLQACSYDLVITRRSLCNVGTKQSTWQDTEMATLVLSTVAIILLLSQTPVQKTLRRWSRGSNNATQGNPKKEVVRGSS